MTKANTPAREKLLEKMVADYKPTLANFSFHPFEAIIEFSSMDNEEEAVAAMNKYLGSFERD
jgi:hypothetical protein